MCGITGYLGNKNCFDYILNGLKQLQNRGYDSAGISSIKNKKIVFNKFASTKEKSALELLEKYKENYTSSIAIGHTRWATHGPKTDINSHPHNDMYDEFSLVHNGIIENYKELKDFLKKKNYEFKSQTDTEVIVNLISYNYKICKNVQKSIENTISKLEGTYALCIISIHEPNKLYCVRHGSPLLISINENMALIASEQSGFNGIVSSYICLENNDLCVLSKKLISDEEDKNLRYRIEFISKNTYNIEKSNMRRINKNNFDLTPDPYPHWTLKEINEQVESSLRAISFGGRLLDDNNVKLGGLIEYKDVLQRIDNIIFLGCGTSYHAGMMGVGYFKDLCNFNTIQIFDGAEFTEKDIPNFGHTALILLSQSGETKDLHRCIDIAKDKDLFLMGVINVVDSMIAREVNCGCYLNAGREVAVASTKSFTSQCIILSMMAIWFSQVREINKNKRGRYIRDLRKLHIDFKNILNSSNEIYKNLIKLFDHGNSTFILGKGRSEAIANEGALKIKEISYIHAEGYSGSSLKHGPFGLLEENFPVILVDPNDQFHSKMNNVYEEIKSRYANIITITDDEKMDRDNVILIPKNENYRDLISIIPLQLLGYELSIARGINPDFPRNLAKCVTTE
jgi:glutamine---fructose-6-phosphate transaminase (isomerizing)